MPMTRTGTCSRRSPVSGPLELSIFALAATASRLPLAACALLAYLCPCRAFLVGPPGDFDAPVAGRPRTLSMEPTGKIGDSAGRIKGPDVQPPNRPSPCTYWVVAGRLLAGEYPLAAASRSDDECRKRLGKYLDAGITDFIDLTECGEKRAYDSLLMDEARRKGISGVTYQRLSIPDFSVPPTSRMNEVLDSIDEAINASRCVYVHCRGGIGRTGTTVGCFLVRHGNTGREALDEVNRLFQFSDRRFDSYRSPETDEQERFVVEWKTNDTRQK